MAGDEASGLKHFCRLRLQNAVVTGLRDTSEMFLLGQKPTRGHHTACLRAEKSRSSPAEEGADILSAAAT